VSNASLDADPCFPRRIVDEFELVDGWMERYETLIDFGRRLAEDVLDHPLVVLETTGLSRRLSPHRLAAYREILAWLRELAS
jgi:sulfur transfer protein SufE